MDPCDHTIGFGMVRWCDGGCLWKAVPIRDEPKYPVFPLHCGVGCVGVPPKGAIDRGCWFRA